MGVAIDERGRDPAPLAIDDPLSVARGGGKVVFGAHEDNASVTRGDRAGFDDSEPRAPLGEGRETRIDPDRVEAAGAACLNHGGQRLRPNRPKGKRPAAGDRSREAEAEVPVVHAARALTPEGWKSDVRVTIEDGAIASVQTEVSAKKGDECHAIMAPAAMNLHSHAFQRAMAGLAEARGKEADTFWTWREAMYRFALTMSPEDVEAVAAQLYVEMLEAGFAAVAEFHYLHNAPDGSPYERPAEMAGRILAAAGRAGIGITLLPVFYAHSTFGGAPPTPEQRRFVTDIASFARLLEDCRGMIKETAGQAIGVAPHSLRAVTPAELLELVAARRRRSHPHSRRRADQGSRGLRRFARGSPGALALGQYRRRRALVPCPCDAYGCGRDAGPCALGRSRRALSGDGSQSWRRDLQCGRLHPRRRALWGRHGFQCLDRSRRRTAPARICAEVARAGAQRVRPAGDVVRAGDARGGLARRGPGFGAELGQARAGRSGGHSDLSRRSSDPGRQGRRSDPRRVDFFGRQCAGRLRVERRTESRRRRPPCVQGTDRRAIREDDARAWRAVAS